MKRWVLPFLLLLLFQFELYAAPAQTLPSDTNASINEFNNTLGVSPASKTTFVPPNGQTHDFFYAVAVTPGNSGLNITVTKEGENESWIDFDGANRTDLYVPPAEQSMINFTVTIPPGTSSTLYHFNLSVNSSFGELEKMDLTVNVTDDVGMINVTVKDPLGGMISDASVFIWTPVNVLKDAGSTNDDGYYETNWLVPGNYTVEATAAGYDTNTKNTTVYGDLNVSNATVILNPTGAPVLEVTPVSISETGYTGSQISKTMIISNTGDLSLVNVTLNATVGWISFSKTRLTSVPPFSSENVYAYLGPLSTATTYNGQIIVDSENDGNQTIPVAFDVRSTPPGDTGGDTGGTTPTTGGFPPSVRDLEIVNFPGRVNASQGETRLVGIQVKNTGDVRLTEVSVSVGGPFNVRVSPGTAEILVGFTKTFIANIDVPADAEMDTYSFIVIASGGGVSDTKTLEVDVIPVREEDVEENLRQTIQEMRELVNSIWGEAVKLGTEGYDMSEVFSALQNATRKLNNAEGSIDLGNYPSARIELNNMRSFAEEAVNQMAQLKAITVIDRPPFWEYLPLAALAVVLIIGWVASQSKFLKKELKRKDKIYTALLTTFNLKRPEKPKGDEIPVARLKEEKPPEKEPPKKPPEEYFGPSF